MPFQVFVDDSGAKGQGMALVLAGVIASAEKWAAFSWEWQRALEVRPTIRYFKMREAASLEGQFKGWPGEERDAKVKCLASVINRFCSAVIFFNVDLAGYAQSVTANAVKPLSEPYFLPFYFLIFGACDHLWNNGVRDEVEFIFDDHPIFSPRLSRWYPMVREIARRKRPERFSLLPPSPTFKDDEKFLPLQAADLFAWNCRMVFSGKPNQFDWLAGELQDVKISEYSRNLTKEAMDDVRERARLEGPTEEEFNIYCDLVLGIKG